MVSPTPISFWKKIPVLHGALSGAVAAVSPTLIREHLIPDQLSVIGVVGSLFVLIGFLIVWAYRDELRKHFRISIIISCLALVLLVLLQVYFIETIEEYGNPPQTHRFLVGYELNEEGRKAYEAMGSASVNELIKFAGADRIPAWYGSDYYMVLTVYALSYIVFILGVVLTLGGITAISGNDPPPGP